MVPRANGKRPSEHLEREDEGWASGEVNREGNGARDVVGNENGNNADHGGTAVLQLGEALALKLGSRHFRGEARRIPERLETLQITRFAARRHVVRLDLPLGVVLNDANRKQDLRLAKGWHSSPLLERGELADILEGHALRKGAEAREVHARDRHEPANECSHGNLRK